MADAAVPMVHRPALEYHELHRAGPRGAWRPVLGVVLALGFGLLLMPVAWLVAFAAFYRVTGQDVSQRMSALTDLGDPTPALLAYVNLSLASVIPVVWLLAWALHRMRPRWLTSVQPRMRWGWFAQCVGFAVLALFATVVVSAFLPAPQTGVQVQATVNDLTRETRNFLLVVVLLTPFQAAAEEYLFRGYLTQACGGLVRSRVFAVLVPALLFALAHGAQDPPIFVDRFAFGIVAGILVIVTGGLEAAIAMHVLNNFLAFGLALAFTDMASALNPSAGTWWTLPGTLTQSLVFLGLCVWGVRQSGLRTRLPGGPVLAAREGPV